MKLKFFPATMAAILLGFAFASCGDDDDDTPLSKVPETCREAFELKYPTVKKASWEYDKGYYKAEWKEADGGRELEAWFRPNGPVTQSWAMTNTDFGSDLFMLPTELNVAFEKTEYAKARIDDIDLYEYPDESRNIYVIEVEGPQYPVDQLVLFTASTYEFIKAVPESDRPITPDTQW